MKIYTAMTIIIAIFACVLFTKGFDRKTTNVRKVVVIAVMTSLSVLGRFVFSVVPGFKPVTAVIVITAMYFGGEAGFLCGAFTAVISNIYFGQGPWTPFQMLAYGSIGFVAGKISGLLKNNNVVLAMYGIFAGVVYSFVMDIWTVLWYNQGFDKKLYIAAIITAIPYTFLYALSNVIFLLALRKPLGKKLNRMVKKYRI